VHRVRRLFGGLSGVVYGLLGFAWVAGRLNPRWLGMAPATPIMLFMVGWLVICMLGVFDVLGFSVANAAHLGGLLSGSAARRGVCVGAAPGSRAEFAYNPGPVSRRPMEYQQLIDSLTPDVVARLRRGVETGRWPDGRPLTPEQREHSLQAIIAWDERHAAGRAARGLHR
jgi:hypothetical protein